MSAAAAPAPERGWKSEKVDEAQALARSCAARRPDFQPCDGLSICATHSHGKCFKLHWCCHLGWCHCKSSHVSSPFSAVPRAPAGPSGVVVGTVRPGGRLAGPGLPCRRPGPPWAPGGGNCPRAGPVGPALPWQRDEICGEPTFLATSTKGVSRSQGNWGVFLPAPRPAPVFFFNRKDQARVETG